MDDVKKYVLETARKAREAARSLANLSGQIKDDSLRRMADILESEADLLRSENRKDLEANRDKLTPASLDRLTVTDRTITGMSTGLREIASQADPVGRFDGLERRPNGMLVGKMRVPLGVVGIIYESRPNVTADAGGLCLKSGNAVILRGGSEAIHTNICIGRMLNQAAKASGVPDGAISVIETTDRAAVTEMLRAEGLIDLIVPRGGKPLIKLVMESSLIPVIKHYDGVCHVYVDTDADMDSAEKIVFNAKVQRAGVCNAMETLLVDKAVMERFLPRIGSLLEEAGVEIRGCEQTRTVLGDAKPATEEDWSAEYLDLVLAVRVVDGLDEAIEHIERYGSAHTDSIVTRNHARAEAFVRRVDSSSVMINASPRLADGAEYGLGAEVGISTDRLHARGPMGIEGLTTYKWVVYGDGQIRE